MKKWNENKYSLTFIIFIMLGIMYIHFLNLFSEQLSNGLIWCLSFVLLLLFYYSGFILSSLIQILMIKLFRILPIKVVSLYPITYDGHWEIHPLRLLYNVEGFSNSLIINLTQFIKNDELILKKLKQLLYIRKISIFMSYAILFLLLRQINLRNLLLFFIISILTISLSYFQYGTFWYGYDYLYRKGLDSLKEYLYASKSIMILKSENYVEALNTPYKDHYLRLCLIENYLYSCLIEKNIDISIEFMKLTLQDMIHSEQFFMYDLTLDTKRLNLIKLMGWAGIVCCNKDILQLSIELYSKIYETIVNNSLPVFLKYGANTMKDEIAILKRNEHVSPSKLRLQDMQNIFSFYNKLFES